ncbi:hypothetical protein B0A49_03739 [Cryomyces minteri]|uniref:Uncharacterized protein n=1 Tax=Cryomyces minteri TaxID=331657 RepID=A0A4U0XTD6_9PEZI|nr:hypothetical protein B0A49_03739 [Cryomyces minteri]
MVTYPINEEDEEYHSFSSEGELENGQDELETVTLEHPPIHPVACMQGAFEESIMDSTEDPNAHQPDKTSPEIKRTKLLKEDYYDETTTSRWKHKAGAKFHTLWKLMAQIAFGVHLLHQRLAKSDEEVVKILQTHVDEVDGFLEKTTEDFDLALKDIDERIRYLRLPLEHLDIFDAMLDDKNFRTSIIDGNDQIERIVDRTARAMNTALVDVSKGLAATEELRRYLDKLGPYWTQGSEELAAISIAMQGNAEGWYRCFRSLQMKGNQLGVSLVQLGSIVAEISKRAGTASRRNRSSDSPSSAPPTPKDGIQDNIAVSVAASEAPALYYDYPEQYEKFVHNTPEPLQTSMGFVQRIKTILEERAATEDTATRSQPHVASDVANVADDSDAPGVSDGVQPALSEMAELPASPVVKRITRALITAVTSPSSEKNESSTDDIMITNIEVKVGVTPSEDSTTSMLSEQSSDVAGAASSEEFAKRLSTLSDATTTISMIGLPTNGVDHALGLSVPGSASTENSQKVDAVEEAQNAQSSADPISLIQVGDDTTRRSVVSSLPDEPTFDVDEPVEPQFAPGALLEDPLSTRASKPPLAIHPLPLGSGMVALSSFPVPPGQRHSSDMTISSEGVTDLAVRFSVPQHTGAGKPQLVTISAEDTSNQSSGAEHKLVETSNPLLPKITLIQPDLVAPPPRSYSDSHDNQVTINPRLSVRKSSARRLPDVEEPESTASRLSRDGTTTDLRFSSLKYPSAYLPGLKEETQDDVSTTDLRISSYNFPVPRSSTLKALQQRAKQIRDSPSHVGPPKHSSSRPLGEIRDLPSLNFSRMDLITKLNDALEARSSRSLDGVRPRSFSGIHSPVPERPALSDLVRERYKSFFAKEKDFELPVADNVEEGGAQKRDLEDRNAEQDEEKDAEAILDPTRRPLSPEDFITVITEVNRLSVPSVNGLTERLSELLPSLKRYHSEEYLSDDETVQSTIETIHGLGRVRPRTMMTVRSSGGLRQLAATADLIVMNGTTSRDSTFKDAQDPRLMKELPPLPNNADQMSVSDSRNRESTYGIPKGGTPVAELEAPAPALVRVRSLAADGIADLKLSARDSKLMSSSKRSLIDSSPDARPWNLDANYPWADTTPTIEISMPAPAHYRDSSDPTQRSKGATHNPDRSNAPSSSGSAPDLTSSTDGTFSHARKTSKKSVLGSIKRKVGLRTDLDNSGFATGPDILRPDDRAVEPGDRYPTTGLTPPSALNLAEVRSFFSDDSSQTERGGSFRKRLTHLRTRLPPISRVYSADNGSLLRAANGSAFGDSRIGANSSAHTYDGTMGMSKCEFRAKKVVEKIKHLWFRSGELLRTLSGRSQAHTRRSEPNAWLEDSDMYSGV